MSFPRRSPAVDGSLGGRPSPLYLAGQDHQHGSRRGQGLAFGLGGGDRRLLEMVDRLRIAGRPSTTRRRGPCGPTTSTAGSGPPSSTARASVSASRNRPVNRKGSISSASSITRCGALGSVISRACSSRRTAVAGARCVTVCAARRNHATASVSPASAPSDEVTGHPLHRRAGAVEHRGRFPVQSLAHCQREIVIDGVAYQIVAKAETIAGLAEQPGLARRGQRRQQLRGGAARVTSASSVTENVAPKIEAIRSTFTTSSGSRLRRRRIVSRKVGGSDARRASARPPTTSSAPSSSSAPHELDDEQRVAAGARHLLQQERAGRMAGDLAGEVRRLLRGQGANEHVLSASVQGGPRPPASTSSAVRSRAHRRQQGQRQASQVPGDGVHGPQRQRVGPLQVFDGEDDRTRRAELFENVQHGLHDQPPLVGRARDGRHRFGRDGTDPEKAGELAAPGIGCASLHLEGLTQRPQRSVPLQLIASAHKNPKPLLSSEPERLGEQPGLADPRLALDQPHPRRPLRRTINHHAQRIQLGRPADEPNSGSASEPSHLPPSLTHDAPADNRRPLNAPGNLAVCRPGAESVGPASGSSAPHAFVAECSMPTRVVIRDVPSAAAAAAALVSKEPSSTVRGRPTPRLGFDRRPPGLGVMLMHRVVGHRDECHEEEA